MGDDQWWADHGAAYGGNFAKTAEEMMAKIAAEPKKDAEGAKDKTKEADSAKKDANKRLLAPAAKGDDDDAAAGADDQWWADHGAAYGGNFAKTAVAMKAKIAAEPKKDAEGAKDKTKEADSAKKDDKKTDDKKTDDKAKKNN